MIKPESLWSLFKTCADSKWVGDICRALGRQEVDLDYGQKMMLATIRQDSEWMDERIDDQRSRWAERQRKSRASRKSQDVTPCHGDIRDDGDVTIHPYIQPSIHPANISPDGESGVRASDGRPRTVPTDDEARSMAKQIGVPIVYLPKFFAEMQNHGWGYVNRGGEMVTLNRRNFKTILRSFYDQSRKSAVRNDTALHQEQAVMRFKTIEGGVM